MGGLEALSDWCTSVQSRLSTIVPYAPEKYRYRKNQFIEWQQQKYMYLLWEQLIPFFCILHIYIIIIIILIFFLNCFFKGFGQNIFLKTL